MLCKNSLVCQQFLVGFIERLIQVKTICSIKWKLSNKKMSSDKYKMSGISYLTAIIAAISSFLKYVIYASWLMNS